MFSFFVSGFFLRQAGMTTPHLLCFCFLFFFIQDFSAPPHPPPKKNTCPMYKPFPLKFLCTDWYCEKKVILRANFDIVCSWPFSHVSEYFTFHLSHSVTSCWHNEIEKSLSCSIFGSRGNRCLQQI